MSNTIAQSLTALATAKSDITTAITNKDITPNSGDGLYNFASLIQVIGTTDSPNRPSLDTSNASLDTILGHIDTAKTAITNAITAKGVTVPAGAGFADFSALISQIVVTSTTYTVQVVSCTAGLSGVSPIMSYGSVGEDAIVIVVDTGDDEMWHNTSTKALVLKDYANNIVTPTYSSTWDDSSGFWVATFTIAASQTANLTNGQIYNAYITADTIDSVK